MGRGRGGRAHRVGEHRPRGRRAARERIAQGNAGGGRGVPRALPPRGHGGGAGRLHGARRGGDAPLCVHRGRGGQGRGHHRNRGAQRALPGVHQKRPRPRRRPVRPHGRRRRGVRRDAPRALHSRPGVGRGVFHARAEHRARSGRELPGRGVGRVGLRRLHHAHRRARHRAHRAQAVRAARGRAARHRVGNHPRRQPQPRHVGDSQPLHRGHGRGERGLGQRRPGQRDVHGHARLLRRQARHVSEAARRRVAGGVRATEARRGERGERHALVQARVPP